MKARLVILAIAFTLAIGLVPSAAPHHYLNYHVPLQPVWGPFSDWPTLWLRNTAAASWPVDAGKLWEDGYLRVQIVAAGDCHPEPFGWTQVCSHSSAVSSPCPADSGCHIPGPRWCQGGDHQCYSHIHLNSYNVAAADRQSVVCHEVGHALGLDHYLSAAGCMTSSATRFPCCPDSHDIAVNRSVYNGHHGFISNSWVEGGGGCGKPVRLGPLSEPQPQGPIC